MATETDALIDSHELTRNWSDEVWDARYDECRAVYDRALVEPSVSLSDIAAKARLALGKHEQHADDFDGPSGKLVVVLLREIIALCP